MPLLDHVAPGGLRDAERGREVCAHDALPLVFAEVEHRAAIVHADAVDEHI
jgi:hypothetical protein